jgi:hypothetical protein
MYVCMYYMCDLICVYVCVCMHLCIGTYNYHRRAVNALCANMHTYIHACMHKNTHTHTYMHKCIGTHILTDKQHTQTADACSML